MLINNDTYQRETLSERPIRPPLRASLKALMISVDDDDVVYVRCIRDEPVNRDMCQFFLEMLACDRENEASILSRSRFWLKLVQLSWLVSCSDQWPCICNLSYLSCLNLVQEETKQSFFLIVRRSQLFYLRNGMPYLDDIWYVGRARVNGEQAEFWACRDAKFPGILKAVNFHREYWEFCGNIGNFGEYLETLGILK